MSILRALGAHYMLIFFNSGSEAKRYEQQRPP